MITNRVEEYQQSFIPEGWVSIDRSQNRLSVFLRIYPFEEKFEGIREEFERRRYEERKKAGVLRKIQGDQEERHFDFYDEAGVKNKLTVKERRSAAGRKAFDFYGLLKLFFACMLKNSVQVTEVDQELHDNPAFQLECFGGSQLPSYDVLAAFDREMNGYGLMRQVRKIAVATNFGEGINKFDDRLIVDVTHSEGNGKIGKMTKQCRDCHKVKADSRCERCVNGKPCNIPKLIDPTIDTVHKNKGKVMKAHKYQMASTGIELLLGTLAFNGKKSDGGESFEQILQEIKKDNSHWIDNWITRFKKPIVIYTDGIYNTAANREMVVKVLGPGTKLSSKPNPGNRKTHKIRRKGIESTVDKRANVRCEQGAQFKSDAREIDKNRYRFVIDDKDACLSCPLYQPCSGKAKDGKTLRIGQNLLPHCDWDDPEFTKSYEKKYPIRTGIERIIGRGKDLSGYLLDSTIYKI